MPRLRSTRIVSQEEGPRVPGPNPRDTKPGQRFPGSGRQKGRANYTTRLTREAIIEGLSICGGKDGLVGFVVKAIKKDIRNGVTMLGMVTPRQVDAHVTHTEIAFQTVAELDADLVKNGLPKSSEIFRLDFKGTQPIEEGQPQATSPEDEKAGDA
jgi:hypothetical protein